MKKRITAIMITLAMLAAMTACNDGTNTPAQTTVTTVGDGALDIPPVTTVETAETTTEAVTTEDSTTTAEETPSPSLPEFDINSEECLMYRLLDMTYEEIEAEFGEMELHSFSHGAPNPQYRLYLNETDYYGLTYSYKEADEKGVPNDGALPINVSVETNSLDVFPNIHLDQKPDEVSGTVSRWDEVRIYPAGISSVTTVLYVDDYKFCVMWDTPYEMRERIRNDMKGKSDDEKEKISQRYADDFLNNLKNENTKVENIYAIRK